MKMQSYTDKEIIESYLRKEQKPFSWFYMMSQPKFSKHFEILVNSSIGKALENMRFMKDDSFINDLFSDSMEKLLRKILYGKLYVEGDEIFVTRKNGDVEKLTSSLYSYLQGIGDYTLKTLARESSKDVGKSFEELRLRLDDVDYPQDSDYGPDFSIENLQKSDGYEPTEEDEEGGFNVFKLVPDEDADEEWNGLIQATSQVVSKMKEPCRTIFRLTYYQTDGKKLPDAEIAEKIGQKNANVVKTTRNRCLDKFHKKLVEVVGVIKGYKRK